MSSTRTSPGIVAVLAPDGDDPSNYFHAVIHGSGTPVAVETPETGMPEQAGALLAIGTAAFGGPIPIALRNALELGKPVLGAGWGMHAVNVALGGSVPVAVPGATGEAVRLPAFISPGGKLSYTIAGSGWVTVPFSNTTGIRAQDLSPALMASCYRDDRFLAAIEMPGRNWIIGVQWNAHEIDTLPAGFDSLLLALVERAAGVQ